MLLVFLSTRSSFLSLYTVIMLRVLTCLLKKLDDDDDDDDDDDITRTPTTMFYFSFISHVLYFSACQKTRNNSETSKQFVTEFYFSFISCCASHLMRRIHSYTVAPRANTCFFQPSVTVWILAAHRQRSILARQQHLMSCPPYAGHDCSALLSWCCLPCNLICRRTDSL